MPQPEQQARTEIDRLLAAAGWVVQDVKAADLQAARGVALREFELNPGCGTADYLLYVDGRACGVIEAEVDVTSPLAALRQTDLPRAYTAALETETSQ